jgi:hypothetical protein
MGTAATNQNYIHEEIKSRFNSGNASYHSVQNLLSSCLLSKNVKIRTHKTMFSFFCGHENWYLTSMKEHRLRVFENGLFRMKQGHRQEEVTEAGGNCIMKFHNLFCSPYTIEDEP